MDPVPTVITIVGRAGARRRRRPRAPAQRLRICGHRPIRRPRRPRRRPGTRPRPCARGRPTPPKGPPSDAGASCCSAAARRWPGWRRLGSGRMLSGRSAQAADRSGAPEPPRISPQGFAGRGGRRAEVPPKHETLPPPPEDASIDVPGMPDLITPASSFYLIDTALTSPRIDVNTWKLSVKGAVDNPVEFSYKDLLGMNTRESDITLSCVSNQVGGGLISNGRWTGVLLSDVLVRSGREPGQDHARLRAAGGPQRGRLYHGLQDRDSAGRPRGAGRLRSERQRAAPQARLPGPSRRPRPLRLHLGNQVDHRDRAHRLGLRRLLDPTHLGKGRPREDPVPHRYHRGRRPTSPPARSRSAASPGPPSAASSASRSPPTAARPGTTPASPPTWTRWTPGASTSTTGTPDPASTRCRSAPPTARARPRPPRGSRRATAPLRRHRTPHHRRHGDLRKGTRLIP